MSILNKKGVILASIIIVKFILATSIIVLFPDYSYISSFLLGLVVPLIFITQLRHQKFYKYFGFLLLFQVFISLLIHFVSESDVYLTVVYFSYLVAFAGYLTFLVYSLRLDDMQKTTVYLIILMLNVLYINQTVLDYILRLNRSSLPELVLRVLVPFVLSWMSLIFQIVLIMHECKVQAHRNA